VGDRKQKKREREEEEESDRGKNVISPLFSLLNRLQPVRGVLWPNFTEPGYLLAKCSKVGVRQQRTITLSLFSNVTVSKALQLSTAPAPKQLKILQKEKTKLSVY